jgi:two-component system response regulator FixJ
MTPALVTHVVDDDDAIRGPLVALAEAAGHAAAGHASAEAFLRDADLGRAGCVVADVRMPGMNGIELLRVLRRQAPGLPVILITGHGEVALAVEALKAGATDFIEKPFDGPKFQGAVREAVARGVAAKARRRDLEALRERAGRLTDREREVMRLVVDGSSNADVAAALAISVRTAENHRARVLAKMEARGLPDLVRMGLRLADG